MDPHDHQGRQQQYHNYPAGDPNIAHQDGYMYGNQAYAAGPYNSYAPAWTQSTLQNQHAQSSYLMPQTQQWSNVHQQQQGQQIYPSGWINQDQAHFQNFQSPQSQQLNNGYGMFQTSNFQQFEQRPYDQGNFQAQSVFPEEVTYLPSQTQAFDELPPQTVSPAAVTSLSIDHYAGVNESPRLQHRDAAARNQSADTAVVPQHVEDKSSALRSKCKAPNKFGDKNLQQFIEALAPRPGEVERANGMLRRDTKTSVDNTDSKIISSATPQLLLARWFSPDSRGATPREPAKRFSRHRVSNELKTRQGDKPWKKEQVVLVAKLKLEETDDKASSSEGDEESSDEDGTDSDVQSDEVPPYPKVRPTDNLRGLEYDALKAVWAPKSDDLSSEALNDHMAQVKDVLQPLNKSYPLARRAYHNAKKDGSGSEQAMQKFMKEREKYRIVLSAFKDHGHTQVLQGFGFSDHALSMFRNIIQDRTLPNPLEDGLVHDSLKLLCFCQRFTPRLFELFKFDHYIAKWTETTQPQETQALADRTLKHLTTKMAKLTKSTKPQDGNANKKAPVKSESSTSTSKHDTLAGSKRSRVEEPLSRPASDPPAKKPAISTINRPVHSGASSRSLGKDAKTNQVLAATGVNGSARDVVKAKPPLAKSMSLAGLKSASKRSNSEASKVGETLKPPQKPSGRADTSSSTKPTAVAPNPPKASKPASKPAFSFSSVLADIGKAKEVPGPAEKAVEEKIPETEEQRKKRERKESRRHLRVSFETGDKLERVREFYQYDEEKIRRGEDGELASMKEGVMLKMHKDREPDEEEEYEPPEVVTPLEWYDPAPTDLSVITTERSQDLTTRYGGSRPVISDEKTAQEDRERTTLIAVYPTPADIPTSPQPPPETMEEDFEPEVPFSEPTNDWIRTREANERNKLSKQKEPGVDFNTLKTLMDQMQNGQPAHYPGQPHYQPVGYPNQSQYPTAGQQVQGHSQSSTYQGQPNYQPFGYQEQLHYQAPTYQHQPQHPTSGHMGSSNLAAITANLESVVARLGPQQPTNSAPTTATMDPSIQNALDVFRKQQAVQPGYHAPSAYHAAAQQYTQAVPNQSSTLFSQRPYYSTDGEKVVHILTTLSMEGLPNQGRFEAWLARFDRPVLHQRPAQQSQPIEQSISWPQPQPPPQPQLQPPTVSPAAVMSTENAKKLPSNYKTVVCSFYRKGTCKKGDACTYRHE